MKREVLIGLAIALGLGIQQVAADSIEFVNGDRLQGKIISMQASSLKFNSSVLGEVEIPMAKVKNLKSDTPVELHLSDGSVLKQPVETAADGSLVLQQTELLSRQKIVLEQISMINPPPEKPVEWEGRLGAGLTVQTGNSVSQDAHVNVDLKRETEQDRILLGADYVENRVENTSTGRNDTTKRRYALNAHYDYFLSPDYYVYGDVSTEKEVTADLDLRLTIGSGFGYRWIDTETTELNVEAGISWVNESFSDETDDNDYLAARTAWRFDHDLNDKVHVFHYGQWFPSLEDTEDQLVKTETGIRSKISAALYIEAKVQFDYDNTPAIDTEKEDVTYIFGAGWNF